MSKSIVRSIKNVTNGYTTAQVKVRNATSNDSFGPATSDMQEISALTYENHELFEIMDMIDRRLNDKGKNWRHVMKALILLDYLIHTGSENVVLWSKDNIYIVKTLREFQYVDEDGRDQGATIRSRAKELTSLLQDDDRLRQERLNKGKRRRGHREGRDRPSEQDHVEGANRRRSSAATRNNLRTSPVGDDELQRALDESRLTAEEDEARRKRLEGEDEDLRKAIMLSREEDQQRDVAYDNSNNIFNTAASTGNQQQANLIDFGAQSAQSYQPQPIYQFQQQPQQPQYQQVDIFGNPVYQQQPLTTGFLQNAYATGGFAPVVQQTGYPQQIQLQQQQQPLQSIGTGYIQQPQSQLPSSYEPQEQPQPLQPLKTGSNNPFASKIASPPSNPTPSLNQIRQTSQPAVQTNGHLSELNNLLATGEGIDTYGNTGDLRIPAQHTRSTFVNSQGTGMPNLGNNNPFMGQQYTGVVTTNAIQPAFTGYGFGNAQQSQQDYQQNQYRQGSQSLIDI